MSLLDDPLLLGVEDGSLPASDFHHRQHVYVTWCYLSELPLEEALLRITRVLRAFATKHGVAAHYHATMTWAHVLLVHDAMREGDDFEMVLARVSGGRARIATLYGDVLQSAEARAGFVLPPTLRR